MQQDLLEARRFLRRLDPDAREFTFQTFDDSARKRGKLAQVLYGVFDKLAADLIALQEAGAGVFVMINEGDGKGRRAENVIRVRAVFADLDGAPLSPAINCGLKPHIVVESSPNHFHVYWLVNGLPLDQFAGVQRRIAQQFGGDPVVDLCRVMRLPGFLHLKNPSQPVATSLHG